MSNEGAPPPEIRPDPLVLQDDERADLMRLGRALIERGLGTPARLILESTGPLHFVMAQAMVGLGPMVSLVWRAEGWKRMATILEKREAVSALLAAMDDIEDGRAPSDELGPRDDGVDESEEES